MPGALQQQFIHSNQGLDSSVVFYCPMVGANGGTIFTDLSAGAHGITVNNVTTSTSQSKFDGSSASFNGSTSSLVGASSTDYNFPGDFTVDFWLWTSTTGVGNARLCSNQVNGSGGFELMITVSNTVRCVAGGTLDISGSTNICNSAWHHIAFTRSGSTCRIFVDGNLEASASDSTSWSPTSTWVIGALHDLSGFRFTGNLQMMRISKGAARWTAAFTPPAIPFS